ncbi:LAME_0G07206g1_1 [Lachancea meyersii CBS 8951]|uniref:LAME_0G07206g1_1 n=1 Tax=Lachancea meyersii CBS 8951 TaxID=1266667 RepID=A0A1G4K7T7_9SACH|nr:LAME_0G07206g1_1 [Lachancea meyersii CBS 8951]
MLGLGNSHLYSVANQSSNSNISRDEKYDYNDEVSDEDDESGIFLGKVRAENGFSLRSFIDQINAKTKALAIARELDAKRGIVHQDATTSAGSIDSTSSTSSAALKTDEGVPSRATIRRIPSGARASTAQPDLSATPMKDVPQNGNSHAQTINDLLVQSTPINTSKSAPSSRSTQPRDLLKEKFIESHKPHTDYGRLTSMSSNMQDASLDPEKPSDMEIDAINQRTAEISSAASGVGEKDQKINELQALVQDQDQRATRLFEQIRSLQAQVSMQQELARSIHEQRSLDQEELKKCNEQITFRDHELDKIKEHIDQLNQDFETHTQELEKEVGDLRVALNNNRSSTDELTAKVSALKMDKTELENKLQLQRTECVDLQSSRKDEQEKSQKEIRELNSKLQVSETLIESLRASADVLRKELDTEKNDFAVKSTVSEAKFKELRDKNDKLEKDVESLTAETTKESSHHKDIVLDLEEKLQNALEETEKAKTRYNMLEKQHGELKDLRDSLEGTNDELKSVVNRLEHLSSEQVQTIGKLEEEAERKVKKEGYALSSAKKHSKQLDEKIRQLQDILLIKKGELDTLKEEQAALSLFLSKATLFQLPVGELILEQYNRDRFCCQLDTQFTVINPAIAGFLTQDQIESSSSTLTSLEAAKSDVDRLQSSINKEWQPKVKALETEIADRKQDQQQLRGKIQSLDRKIEKLETKIAHLDAERETSLKEKEKDVKTCQDLGSEINLLRSQLAENQKKSFVELSSKIDHLSEDKYKLQGKLQTLEASLKEKESSVAQLSENLDQERAKQAASLDELQQLRKDLTKAKGNPARAINFQTASQARPHLNRKLYDSLMVDNVNDMDVVDLQNVVKNLILLLEIPLSKITKKMPLVAIYLRYEKSICLHFANKLHHLIFRETIDIKRFTNIVYGQYIEHHDICHLDHPLEACLDNLYKAVSARISTSL